MIMIDKVSERLIGQIPKPSKVLSDHEDGGPHNYGESHQSSLLHGSSRFKRSDDCSEYLFGEHSML